jgi:hypothetical protein
MTAQQANQQGIGVAAVRQVATLMAAGATSRTGSTAFFWGTTETD